MDPKAKNTAIEEIRQARNVLVTVSNDPSVDQLAAAIGLTLLLNKLNKHATAVFSGKIPSTIEYLKPDEILEGNTDSLRDFIISLDKNKADKLRYKVEDDVVRIYVTPYHTSLSEGDLEFSQGDYNVDVVIALGVQDRRHLDQAIQEHGRILHDASIISVIAGSEVSEIGGIDWVDNNASSVCEMIMSISESLKADMIDPQIATAFLTGIVAETDRFSNQKTTPRAMSISAELMSAGANQQLISEYLNEEPEPEATENTDSGEPSLADVAEPTNEEEPDEEGVLKLNHNQENFDETIDDEFDNQTTEEAPELPEVEDHHIGIDDEGSFNNADQLREAVAQVQSQNQSQGSFKGKTIMPLNEEEAPSDDTAVFNSNSGPEGEQSYQNQEMEENQAEQAFAGQPDMQNVQPSVDEIINQDEQMDNVEQANFGDEDDGSSQNESFNQVSEANIPGVSDLDNNEDGGSSDLIDNSNNDFLAEQQDLPEQNEEPPKDLPVPDTNPEPVKFSKYIQDKPSQEHKLNALDGPEVPDMVNPMADIPSSGPVDEAQFKPVGTQDPLLSTQHDAESASINEVPETKDHRLYDDGVGTNAKPLGPEVKDSDTLDQIEHNVEQVAGKVHDGSADDDAQKARDAVAQAFGGSDNSSDQLPYLELESDPSKQAPPPPAEVPTLNLPNQDNQSDNNNQAPPPVPPPIMPPTF